MAICHRCGQDNPAVAHFCFACGAPLEAGASRREERKVVAVLFADLVGFTQRAEKMDPEDVRASLAPYLERVRTELEQLGGTVEKFIGDAVMAVFGVPVAHEDEPERAVTAALRILSAIEELNSGRSDFPLALRVGVNTGEVIVDLSARAEEGDIVVTGDVVNTAARLQQAAPIGTVVVGETTYHATRARVEYEELEPATVKGKAEPVSAWRATTLRLRPVEPTHRAPFIGREQDLALLIQTFARTLREKSVQLVTVAGEAGVGKSRLVAELRRTLSVSGDDVMWRRGRCVSYGEGVTFWALGEIVKSHAGILESDSPEEVAKKLAAAVADVVDDGDERSWFVARLGVLVGAEGAQAADREELFTAWRRFLEAIAARTPFVLIVEDIHWADAALLAFLDHLVEWGSGVPLLVVCTARPELYEHDLEWGSGKRNASMLTLSPLTEAETAELVDTLSSQAALPAETRAVLLERAGGNPLYAEEFVRMLLDRGFLGRREPVAVVAPGAEIPVPETVQGLIAARLDTLTPERKVLIQSAAVIGRTFWTGAVASMLDADDQVVREGLHELARREFVRPVRSSSVQNQEEYTFWHALVRDVAYNQIPRAARAGHHRSAAAWIERISKERVTDHAEFLAHHYRQALDLAHAAGDDAQLRELEEPTGRFLAMAGDRAFPLDVRRAEEYYRQALEHVAAGHPERARILGRAADAAWLGGRLTEAERYCHEAIDASRARGNPLGEGEAMVRVATALKFRGESRRAWDLLHEAVEMLEREAPGAELVRAYGQLARDHMLAGNDDQCLAFSEKTLALASKLELDEQVVLALQTRGSSRCSLGDWGGLDDLYEARRRAREIGVGHEIVRSHNNLGSNVLYVDGSAAAHEIFRAGIEIGERRGLVGWVLWGKAHMVWTLFDLGEWDKLLDVADELVAWDQAHGRSYTTAMALPFKAHVLATRGDTDAAAALVDDFMDRAREIADPQVVAPAAVAAAFIEHVRGDGEAALAFVREYENVTKVRPAFRSQFLAEAVRVCAAESGADRAEALTRGVVADTARSRAALATARLVIAEVRERLEEPAAEFAEVAGAWQVQGCQVERAHALLLGGRCLVGLGRGGEAARPLSEARAVFERLQARPLAAEAARLLAAAAAQTPV